MIYHEYNKKLILINIWSYHNTYNSLHVEMKKKVLFIVKKSICYTCYQIFFMSKQVLKEIFMSALQSIKISEVAELLEAQEMIDEMFEKLVN